MMRVDAATKQELINKSRNSYKGKRRLNKRDFSNVEYPNRALKRVDINKWIQEDILDATISVQGETDKYEVTVSFYGVWANFKGEPTRENIREAIKKAFTSEDVYVYCTCPDFRYRFAYVATRNGYIAKEPQSIPADITNPHDSLGSCCKHTLLCITRPSRWINELANNTYKYFSYIEKHNKGLYESEIEPRIKWQA